MRRIMLILMVVCLCFSLTYAFESKGISYTVISEIDKTCEVKGFNDTEGNLVLPPRVAGYTLVRIGDYAFHRCSGLTSVKIPDTVTEIGEQAFYGCNSLKVAEFGSVESLCRIDFEDYTSNPLYYSHRLYIDDKEITNLVIPSNIGILKDFTFISCSRLLSVEIPPSVTSIGKLTFGNCTGLKSVIIPYSVTNVDYMAFNVCVGLIKSAYPSTLAVNPIKYGTSIKYPVKNINKDVNIIIENGFIYEKGKTALYFVPYDIEGEYVVPETVSAIGDQAFESCCAMTSVKLNDSLLSIGEKAFAYCHGLNSVEIPDKVKTVGNDAFLYCNNLRTLIIGSSVERLGYHVLSSDCRNLTEIRCRSLNPPIASDDTFSDYNYSATLRVPSSSISSYRNAENCWHRFNYIIGLDDIVAESITLSASECDVKISDTMSLTATLFPENITDKTIDWRSSDNWVATVSDSGLVTPVYPGTATITATCGKVSATCQIKVSYYDVLVDRIELNPYYFEGKVGESFEIDAIVHPESANKKELKWFSEDNRVATVDAGVVHLEKQGDVIIYAEACDGSKVRAGCRVAVFDNAGIEDVVNDENVASVNVRGGSIYVSNKPQNAVVRVFNLQGVMLVESEENVIHNLTKGFYIVKVGNKSFKVSL